MMKVGFVALVVQLGALDNVCAGPPPFIGTNVSTDPAVQVEAYRGKPQSPMVSCRVRPVMEKLFADKNVRSAEITVALNSKNGAHLSSTLHVNRDDSDLTPLNVNFSSAGDSRVTLTIAYIKSTGMTKASMDLIKLCQGKKLTK